MGFPRPSLVISMRIRIILLSVAVATLTAPLASSTSDCDEARAHLRQELEASGWRLSLPVAHAIKEAVDACPDAATPALALTANGGPTPPPAKIENLGLVARECGFTTAVHFRDPGSRITTWTMTPGYAEPYYETGPADVTYFPATDSTAYEARGPRNGLIANGDGTGTVILFGVPVPTSTARATSGCSPEGGDLCWAYAEATLHVPTDAVRLLTVTVFGEAKVCG